MKDDDEGGDEVCCDGGDEDSDEWGEWLILSCLRGFEDKQTDRHMNKRMDICECRVASVTENIFFLLAYSVVTSKLTFYSNLV